MEKNGWADGSLRHMPWSWSGQTGKEQIWPINSEFERHAERRRLHIGWNQQNYIEKRRSLQKYDWKGAVSIVLLGLRWQRHKFIALVLRQNQAICEGKESLQILDRLSRSHQQPRQSQPEISICEMAASKRTKKRKARENKIKRARENW